MPKSCNECKIDLRTDICQAFCEWNAEHPYSIMATDRLPDCPLSEAPEPCEDVSDTNVGKMCEYYDLCRNGRDEKKLREELLSAQPECEDAVSRADVDILIEEAQTAWLRGDILLMYPTLKKGLQKVPPVTPKQPGWIPCSRELPKKDGDYLVTTHSGQIARYIFIGGSSEEYWRRCATAWMPLPKPWEGENA